MPQDDEEKARQLRNAAWEQTRQAVVVDPEQVAKQMEQAWAEHRERPPKQMDHFKLRGRDSSWSGGPPRKPGRVWRPGNLTT